MNPDTLATLIVAGGGLAVVVWVLHKIGKALAGLLEALATIAVAFVVAWMTLKVIWWCGKQACTHWRTSLVALAGGAWCWRFGWLSLTITLGVVTIGLIVWMLTEPVRFDIWVGRHLRAWRLRWCIYAPRLPRWLRACDLVSRDHDADRPMTVSINPLRRARVSRRPAPSTRVPKVLGVRSGPSWDEVRVKLVPGQKPEDFDEATRALASARGVARCQVRELRPNVVSIDFQRRDLLAGVVACRELPETSDTAGSEIDLSRVWSGRTEYGLDWHQSLRGSHTLYVGATGAGKNSYTWAPLVSIAPAIRDGLVRCSAIDPKGMELAYGRGIFCRYAQTGREAIELLDDILAVADKRKTAHAGARRDVPISRDDPLELIDFDEIGALTRYVSDRKLRERINDQIAVLTTQGRALGITVRGYVQEPNKDTVAVRDLFPRRVCLRVTAKSHVWMALGEHAYERGAWANRIAEDHEGVGYLFGNGIREPLRVRAGWVPDPTIKALEAYVTTQPDTTGLYEVHVPEQRSTGGLSLPDHDQNRRQ